MPTAAAETYTGTSIQALEGLEPVRKRPGMYMGGTGKTGLHHLVWEIVDNAVDEATNGYASQIDVTLHKDGQSVTVEDNDRGIPVDKHPTKKIPTLEVILTTLHSGGRFDGSKYVTCWRLAWCGRFGGECIVGGAGRKDQARPRTVCEGVSQRRAQDCLQGRGERGKGGVPPRRWYPDCGGNHHL